MDLAELQRKLISAARLHEPSERVPLAFGGRVLAQLRAGALKDSWALWAQALWRAAAPCAGVMLLLGAWSWFTPPDRPPTNDLSQDFENTVLAAADQEPSTELLW